MSFLKTHVTLRNVLLVVTVFSETIFEVGGESHFEREGMSDSDLTHSVLCLNLQLSHEHEH